MFRVFVWCNVVQWGSFGQRPNLRPMASSFVRKGSPFYCLKVKRPDGTWRQQVSRIRIDDPDGERKVKMAVLNLQMEELGKDPGAGGSLKGWGWVPAFLQQHYQNEKSLGRAKNAWAAVGVFCSAHGLEDPTRVTHDHGHQYVAWRQDPPKGTVKARSKNTAITEVKIWSKIMQGAIRKGLVSANPLYCLGIKRAAVKEKPEILPEEQEIIEKALLEAPQWMQDCWLVAMKHGCRLREVQVPLIPQRLNLGQRVIVFEGKKGKLHPAPLHRDCMELVKRRQAEKAQLLVELPPAPSKHWYKFFQKLGLGHLSFHSTRVTVVTRLVLAGVPEAKTMKYVGHSSTTVHRMYQRHRPADVDEVGQML